MVSNVVVPGMVAMGAQVSGLLDEHLGGFCLKPRRQSLSGAGGALGVGGGTTRGICEQQFDR